MKAKKKRVWSLEAAVYSALRRAHRNSPEYRECLIEAKYEYFKPSKKGRPMRRVNFTCAHCKKGFSRKESRVDHIQPVVDITGRTTYDEYIRRLFCGKKGLQVLHKACHDIKTKEENSLRRKFKNEQSTKRFEKAAS